MTINHPLRLAVGSHEAGSGKGCAMNVISWENGDTTITDLPACSDPMLGHLVQRLNDTICTHRDGDMLCPTCSMVVLDIGHRTVGTGGGLGATERHVIWVRIAAHMARKVAHLNPDPRVMAAIVAAEAWADEPSANAAYAYAAAAADAANAANAAADAADAAAAAANAAAAAANAAYAANAANAGAYRENVEEAITMFHQLAGTTAPAVDERRTAQAVASMLAATR